MDGKEQRKKIEHLLKSQRLTKSQLALHLNILPQNLNRIIENDNISVVDLQKIAAFLKVGITEFIPTSAQRDVKESTISSMLHVPLVQQYAYAGYLCGFAQEEYMEELPTIPFVVNKEYKGKYRCFEVAGDSMDDGSKDSYEEGDIVLAREIHPEYWKTKLHLHRWSDYIIVHREDGILLKRITEHDVTNHTIRIHSLNNFYKDRSIDLTEVAQLFNIVKCIRNK